MEKEIKLKRSFNTTIRIKGEMMGKVYDGNDGPELSVYRAKNGRFIVQEILNVLDADDLPGTDEYLYKAETFDNIEDMFSYIDCENDEFSEDDIAELKKEVMKNGK